MSLSHREWKAIYGAIGFVSKFISFAIALVFARPTVSDLADLAVGGLFLSSAFIHILPRAEYAVGGSYPYASLVAVVIFAALTLFCFIRDSIALMDENILTACDTIPHTTVRSDLVDEPQSPPPPSFLVADHLPTILLYLVVLVHTVASALWMANLTPDDLTKHAAVVLALQLLEFIGLARYILQLPIRRWLYWLLGFFVSAASASVIAVPMPKISRVEVYSGYASAVVLGFYFFLGSIAVHTGLTQTNRHLLVASITLLVAFALPAAVRAADH
jgi:hypothetical protein